MRVLICLDKFRGSATAERAGDALATGIRSVRPDDEILIMPVADGGEGTIDALIEAGYVRHRVTVSGPLGEPVAADFAQRGAQAVIEMAQASGQHLVTGERQPLLASTYGTGELIAAALDRGAQTIVLTAGGSASTDGGAGLLQALGARLTDAVGAEIGRGGAALQDLVEVCLDHLHPGLAAAEVILASDVDNPLLGPSGAATVFGPQKGATAADVATLEAALGQWADVCARVVPDRRDEPGAGAAGGLGFGALAGLSARRVAGIDFLIEQTGIEAALAGADVVVVGEGCLDRQSLNGKAPIGIAARARRLGVRVIAVAGQIRLSDDELAAVGIGTAYSVLARCGDLESALRDALPTLTAIGRDLFPAEPGVIAAWGTAPTRAPATFDGGES